MGKIITINDVSLQYGKKKIFDNLNLEIEKNTWVCVVGHSGSGKSSLVNVLCGISKYKGYVKYNGAIFDKNSSNNCRAQIGVVFDNDIFVGDTVRDNLTFCLENMLYEEKDIEENVNYISELFEITNIMEYKIFELDNYQKLRVMIASSLVHKPEVLILDNIFRGRKREFREEIFSIIKKYKKKNKLTVVMCTSSLEEVVGTDRVIILANGNIIKDDIPANIFKNIEELSDIGFKLPFVVELSSKLGLYNITDHIYLDMDKLIDGIWK